MKFTLLIFILSAGIFFIAPHAHAAVISKAPNNLGLAGYWSFDDGNGTLAGDSSGNRNTGTTTATTWITGKRGKALSFNGSSSIVDVASSTVFNMGSTVSLSSWFYINSWTNWAGIVGKSNATEGVYVMHLSPTGNKLRFSYNSVSPWTVNVVDSTSVIPVGTWVHAVITYDGTNVRFYINGKLDSTTNIGAISFDACPACKVSMGQDPPGSNEFFNGKIDDVRIYSRALSATEIASMFSSGQATRKVVTNQDLLGYWAMNEGRGNMVGDSSGKQNNGSIVSGSWVTGKKGGAVSFNGTSNYVQVATSTDFEVKSVAQEPFTVSAWVKPTQSPADSQSIFSIGTTDFNSLSLALDLDEKLYIVGSVTGASWGINNRSTNSVPLNQWSLVTYTRSTAGIYTFYINGVDAGGSFTSAGDLFINANSVKIAAHYRNLGGYYYGGSLDDVRFYNRVLSAAEIQALYRQNETKMNSSQNTRLTNGLVGLWSFNGQDYDPASTTAEVLDRSGQGNNADNVAGLTTIGKVGQGINLDGSTAYIDTGTKFPSLTSAISISLWVKPGATQVTYADILGNHQPDFKGMIIQQNAGVTNQYTWGYGDGSGWTNMTGNFNLTANSWQLITVIKDATNCYIYINGQEQVGARGTCSSSIAPATLINFRIGMGFSGGGRNWNGIVDEVRVYNRPLTADEVKQLYNMGK